MLKRAAEIDISWIVAFEIVVANRRLYGKPLDHGAAQFEVEANEYYLRFRDERLVATGARLIRADASVYLSNIAVHPNMRRQGLGRAMMGHLLSLCEDARSVDLAVHPDNRPARDLYTSLGFIPVRCLENFFGDGEPRLIMARTGSAKSASVRRLG